MRHSLGLVLNMKTMFFRCALFLAFVLGSFSMSPLAVARATPFSPAPAQTISLSDLPPEAQTTFRLIRKGGPFPFRRDGIEFQNREGRLPRHERGYYHEYTVATPGSSDRGARRIISGSLEETYYTADHYRSFKRIVR